MRRFMFETLIGETAKGSGRDSPAAVMARGIVPLSRFGVLPFLPPLPLQAVFSGDTCQGIYLFLYSV